MKAESTMAAAERPGFLARLLARLRSRIRRFMGKDEAPNIYPFF